MRQGGWGCRGRGSPARRGAGGGAASRARARRAGPGGDALVGGAQVHGCVHIRLELVRGTALGVLEGEAVDREQPTANLNLVVDDAHEALMASRPHRDNLLSPKFNVAGFGVFRQGHMLYVAQDFGLSMAIYSVQQAKELVSTSVEKLRAQAKMPQLKRINDSDLQSSACAMAKADSLSAARPPAGAYMLRYSSMKPESLPSEISKVIARRGLHTYSAGTCYARTQRYPNGAYWVVLVFY